jgi:hypothetical protein
MTKTKEIRMPAPCYRPWITPQARPREIEYYPSTQLPALNINAPLLALHGQTPAR